MSVLDIFKGKKESDNLLPSLMATDYKQSFFDECKYIWKNYVPKNGQANNLQGELLREIEKIRCEAQDNGNINWDDDYSYFCDFISQELSKLSIFSSKEKQEIKLIMKYIKECGIYAQKFNRGEILDKEVDMSKLAYTKDNLYDVICDKIGKLQKENPEPIPYEKNENIKR